MDINYDSRAIFGHILNTNLMGSAVFGTGKNNNKVRSVKVYVIEVVQVSVIELTCAR